LEKSNYKTGLLKIKTQLRNCQETPRISAFSFSPGALTGLLDTVAVGCTTLVTNVEALCGLPIVATSANFLLNASS